jgi:Tol biopolymer transport system component
VAAPARKQYPRALLVSLAAIAVMLAAFGLYRFGFGGRRPAQFEVDRLTRLTSTGNALIAAVSGDGRYVVHIKAERLQPSLWIRQTATLSDAQIVPGAPVRYKAVSFSPDGNYIYYVTYDLGGGVGTLYRVPVLGGTPQRILEDVDSRISFSPDRQQFAFMRGQPKEGRNYLMTANADGSGVREVAAPGLPDQFLLNATSWSPDAHSILVVAQSLKEGPHLTCLAVDAASGSVRDVCGRWGFVADAQWMPDGRSVVIAGRTLAAQEAQLWQIAYPGGERRRITNDLNNYTGISLTDDGRSIATVQAENLGDLWIAPAADPTKATQLTNARERADGFFGLVWTPDDRLVFSGSASGTLQIWIADADGQNARQLTTDKEPAAYPAVSPDGRFVAYQQISDAGMFVMRVDADGTNRRRITSEGGEFFPLVAPDGRTLFYMSPKGGQLRPFKISVDGGLPAALADGLFRITDVSPDGRQLLGSGWDEAQRRSTLATLSVDGGTPQLLNLPVFGPSAWTRDGKGITYMDVVGGRLNLFVRDLASGTTRQLTAFTTDNVLNFAWSRDGSRLAMLRGTVSSDLVMIAAK